MPVQRFRSLDDARRALWVAPGDPALFARIRSVWRFSSRLLDRRIPRGVRRFRRIEDANAERERWIAARVDALVAERGSTSSEGGPRAHVDRTSGAGR